ncbi:hypothetical protein C3V36_07220 [Lachnospiraceae bacterium oral taxon 500]|nr:hypothetical protein C3V36_07220 [Lachnospiraceae bacterium oral taxon 500]
MKAKVIRGSVQYDGTIYSEGMELTIRPEDFSGLAEVVEALEAEAESGTEKEPATEGANLEEVTNYKEMKKEELLELAKEKGLNVSAGAKRDEVIALLEEAAAHE